MPKKCNLLQHLYARLHSEINSKETELIVALSILFFGSNHNILIKKNYYFIQIIRMMHSLIFLIK